MRAVNLPRVRNRHVYVRQDVCEFSLLASWLWRQSVRVCIWVVLRRKAKIGPACCPALCLILHAISYKGVAFICVIGLQNPLTLGAGTVSIRFEWHLLVWQGF